MATQYPSLYSGMMFTSVGGDKWLIFTNCYGKLVAIDQDDGYLPNLDRTALFEGNYYYSIDKLYAPDIPKFSIDLYYEKAIWSRKDSLKEVTLKEIADKFNVDVSKLRIKDDN